MEDFITNDSPPHHCFAFLPRREYLIDWCGDSSLFQLGKRQLIKTYAKKNKKNKKKPATRHLFHSFKLFLNNLNPNLVISLTVCIGPAGIDKPSCGVCLSSPISGVAGPHRAVFCSQANSSTSVTF